jgi:predicted site-specific integrase-resolvase
VQTNEIAVNANAPLVALRKWVRELGISDTTAWRWTRAGLIHPINVAGKLYLSAEDIHAFASRAKAGEFARPPAGCARKSPQNPDQEGGQP